MRIFRPSGLCWRGLFTKATKAAGVSTAKKMILEAAEDRRPICGRRVREGLVSWACG